MRYFRWRSAIHKSVWVIDLHWYGLLGALCAHLVIPRAPTTPGHYPKGETHTP